MHNISHIEYRTSIGEKRKNILFVSPFLVLKKKKKKKNQNPLEPPNLASFELKLMQSKLLAINSKSPVSETEGCGLSGGFGF